MSTGDADIRTNGYQVLVRRNTFEINGCSMFAKGIIIGQVVCWSQRLLPIDNVPTFRPW